LMSRRERSGRVHRNARRILERAERTDANGACWPRRSEHEPTRTIMPPMWSATVVVGLVRLP
jgi:hypothetical protein